jgi:hypothetical protein
MVWLLRRVNYIVTLTSGAVITIGASGGTVLAAGGTVVEAIGVASAVGIGEGVNLAPQGYRIASTFQGGLEDVSESCF